MKMERIILFANSEYLLKGNFFLRATMLRNHTHMMSDIKGVSSIAGCN